MAENKESFILYCDLIHTVKKMPKDKVAELFIHILEYVNDLNPQTDDLILNLVFEPIKQQLKRDLRKWENVCNRNKINGIKGGRPKNPKEPKKPSGLIENPKNPVAPDNDNDSDNDSDNDNDIISINTEKIKLNLKTEKKEIEKTWRNDYETYLSDCKKGYASIINDAEFMERLQKLNPKINIRSSLEMGFIAYWGSEEGWKNKKAKKSKTINWKSTIIKTIKLNAVYY